MERPSVSFRMAVGCWPVFAAVAVVIILVALRSVVHRSEVIGLGMIMAGAVGNLIDRVVRGTGLVDGAVIDWIKFPNFPNFNIADSCYHGRSDGPSRGFSLPA